MTTPKCNGYLLSPVPFSSQIEAELIGLLEKHRPLFEASNIEKGTNHQKSLHAGSRFYDNNAALVRIYSATTEDAAMQNPVGWINAALEDCAQSDYWYTYEKDWGDWE